MNLPNIITLTTIILLFLSAFIFNKCSTESLADSINPKTSRGEVISNKCKSCHDLTDKKINKIGPYLWGIVNRGAGKIEGYQYSKAHREAGFWLIWDERALDEYLSDPRKMIPGNKMAFVGISNSQDREALVEYLKTLK